MKSAHLCGGSVGLFAIVFHQDEEVRKLSVVLECSNEFLFRVELFPVFTGDFLEPTNLFAINCGSSSVIRVVQECTEVVPVVIREVLVYNEQWYFR